MDLHAFCIHSGTFWNNLNTFWNILHTFWNILHTFWNILEFSACILEHSGTFWMHFECILEHSAFILEHSGTFWNILEHSECCKKVEFQLCWRTDKLCWQTEDIRTCWAASSQLTRILEDQPYLISRSLAPDPSLTRISSWNNNYLQYKIIEIFWNYLIIIWNKWIFSPFAWMQDDGSWLLYIIPDQDPHTILVSIQIHTG